MLMYSKKNFWDLKLIAVALGLSALCLFLCSWAEAVAEHGTDYHYDGPQNDVEGRIEAEQESRDSGGFSSYEDKDGTVHTYENGCENC
jgi:hypothetical protein